MKQSEVLVLLSKLTPYQNQKIKRQLLDFFNLNEINKDARPSVCPCCGNKSNIIKRGFNKDKQRYQCKDCLQRFTNNTNTIMMYSKLERSKFQKIVLDTLSCVPLKQTAADIDISEQSVFLNRHKILCALSKLIELEEQQLCGTIEIDETYELESQKGNRNLKRKARHRGGPSAYRGISHEQICIVTTTDRNGQEIFKAVGFGKPTTSSIQENISKALVKDSIIYADGAQCYDKVAREKSCKLVCLKTHKSYNKVEHLNTVNSIHSMIKKKLANYRGVATKYLNRYLSLFVFIRRYMQMDDNEIMEIIIPKINNLQYRVTTNSLKTDNIFA